MKDRYRLVLEGDVLISKQCSKSKGVTFCMVWITIEGIFVDAYFHTNP